MKDGLRIYAKGSAFSNEVYNLRALELVISNYRIILDRLIAVELGKRQLTPHIKSQLEYQVKIKPGSIEFLIDLVLNNKDEILGSLIGAGTPMLVDLTTKLFIGAIDLRKIAADLAKRFIPIHINIVNSFNIRSNIIDSPVSLNQSTNAIEIIDPRILTAAQVTRAPVNEILTKIDGNFIEFIDFGDGQSIQKLTKADRIILGTHKEELPQTMRIIGRIDAAHFSSGKGTLVSDGTRYPVTWENNLRSKIKGFVDSEGILFKVKAVIDHKRLNPNQVGFHIVDCLDPQLEFGSTP